MLLCQNVIDCIIRAAQSAGYRKCEYMGVSLRFDFLRHIFHILRTGGRGCRDFPGESLVNCLGEDIDSVNIILLRVNDVQGHNFHMIFLNQLVGYVTAGINQDSSLHIKTSICSNQNYIIQYLIRRPWCQSILSVFLINFPAT